MKRAKAKARTRAALLKAAAAMFSARGYEGTTIRDLAKAIRMSTGAVFSHFVDKADLWRGVFGFPYPWRPIKYAPIDCTLCVLLVDYGQLEDGDRQGDHAIEDARFARTIGHNNDGNVGPGEGVGWQFAGWNWSQDYYVEGRGQPVAFVRLDDLALAPPEGMVVGNG